MSTAISESSLLDGLLDPFVDLLTVEQAKLIAGVRANKAVQARADELAHKAHQGRLSEAEKEEYASFMAGYHFLSTLQLKARLHIKASS